MMSPKSRYLADLEQPGFHEDAAQLQAVEALDVLYNELVEAWESHNNQNAMSKWLTRINREKQKQPAPKGLYFWGGVGRGKTYLMDVFFDALPFRRKLRLHFHRFMYRVHKELKELAGEKNPLDIIASHIARDAKVLCFDEFFVSDITDAMILGKLMESLFKRGVTLVATSNIEPENLYKDGLQRERFLPAIKLVQQNCKVLNVDGGVDYRLRTLEQANLYYTPNNQEAELSLAKSFESLAPEKTQKNACIMLSGRPIQTKALCDDVVWFDFEAICDGPRSQTDYIELARLYHAVLVSDVPQFDSKDDQARRFINMVDEFYDRHVKVIVSAEVALDQLYSSGRLSFEFQRTCSRLLEMQSKEFLALPHRPD